MYSCLPLAWGEYPQASPWVLAQRALNLEPHSFRGALKQSAFLQAEVCILLPSHENQLAIAQVVCKDFWEVMDLS